LRHRHQNKTNYKFWNKVKKQAYSVESSLLIDFFRVLNTFVNFTHKNDINSYSFDELVTMNYVPKEHQNLGLLEAYSSSFAKE